MNPQFINKQRNFLIQSINRLKEKNKNLEKNYYELKEKNYKLKRKINQAELLKLKEDKSDQELFDSVLNFAFLCFGIYILYDTKILIYIKL